MFEEYAQEVNTESPTDDEMNAMYEEYERRPRTVECLYCQTKTTATEKELDKRGWYLHRDGATCQFCFDHSVGIALGRFQKAMDNYDEAVAEVIRLAA